MTLNVNFIEMDIITEELPLGDLVFLRQVLQHLSNKQISQIIHKLKSKYQYLVITEHLPMSKNFKPNKDKPQGPDIRLGVNSGVVLSMPPFNLKVLNQTILCEVEEGNGIIQTLVYQLY